MPDSRHALGAKGEECAAQWLAERGYRILDRNVRAGGVELDIVAQHRRTLAFIEVKTRSSQRLGSPVLAVDARKQARIARGAAAWLRDHRNTHHYTIRFDVIACTTHGKQFEIKHWPNAFDASP